MTYPSQLHLSVVILLCLLPRATVSSNLFLRNGDGPNDDIYDSSAWVLGQNTSIKEQNIPGAELTAKQAIEDAMARYENLQLEYIEKKCPEIWGPFPLTSATETIDATRGNGSVIDMACMCGLMQDLAKSQLKLLEETDVHANTENAGIGDGGSEIHSNMVSSSSAAEITPLQAWALSRKPKFEAKCKGGSAAGYPCKNIDLVAHLPLNSFQAKLTGEAPQYANDLWGWTSKDGGREFIVWGVYEGHYFMEVTGFVPQLLGFLPTSAGVTGWQHDVKIAGDFAYIGAEVKSHGVQIFDMKRLLDINPETDCMNKRFCQLLAPDQMYRGTIDFPIGQSHNIVVNEESNFLYVVGTFAGCSGGLHIVDVSDPNNPTFVACFDGAGYVHDAQCVNYRGPDVRYQNSEICFCYNGSRRHVTIVDVTNKSNIQILSTVAYTDAGYTHQGWLSSDQSYIVFGDESDEAQKTRIQRTRTLVLGIADLEEPWGDAKEFFGTTSAVDHNQYVARISASSKKIIPDSDGSDKGTEVIFQANYKAGLRILQVLDYDAADHREIAYFDTFPQSDDTQTGGAWSVFPYFESGLVAISSISEGLFLVKPKYGPAIVDCADKALRYKRNRKRNCKWVGKSKSARGIKSRCKKMWKGAAIFSYCPKTCGSVGLGPCKHLQ